MLLNEVGGMLESSDNAQDIATAIRVNKFPTGSTVALVVDDEIRDELPIDVWMKEFGDDSIFSATAINANRDDNYFGEVAAFNHGDMIANQLGIGTTISKRKDLAEEPGGLIYVANELDIDMWELLEALEGMCADGRALEIDDSTYKIVSTKRHPVRSLFYNKAEDPNSRWLSVNSSSTAGGYIYKLRHGWGPGTFPNDVEVLDHWEKGRYDFVKTDRALSTEELNYYDIEEAQYSDVDASTIADNGKGAFQPMSYSSDLESGVDEDDFYC